MKTNLYAKNWFKKCLVAILLILSVQQIANAQGSFYFTESISSGCTPLKVKFVIYNRPAGSNINYAWTFGNGAVATSSSDTIYYTYNSGGNFTPSVMAIGGIGPGSTSYQGGGIFVGGPGSINTSSDTLCIGESIGMTLTGNYGAANWSFGDGTSTSNWNPTHVYAAAGTYTITAIANNYNCNRNDTLRKVILVQTKGKPSADFTFISRNYCPNDPIQFNGRDNYANAYFWNFGDGSYGNQLNAIHSYKSIGSYPVSFSVHGKCDSNKTTQVIAVTASNPLPPNLYIQLSDHFNNYVNSSWIGDTLTFAINSFIPASAIWYFGNGDSSTLVNPKYVYSKNGNYTVTVKFKNGCGVSSTLQTTLNISPSNAPLNITYTTDITSGCRPLTVHFANYSSGCNFFKWYFGNGDSSKVMNPIYTYNQSGNYQVTLIAYDTTGGGMVYKGQNNWTNINVNGSTMNLSADTSCTAGVISAYYYPSYAPANWDFGDGYLVTDYSAQHTYQDTGVYTIKCMYFNNQCNVNDTLTKQVVIKKTAKPSAYFNYNYGNYCPHDPINFWPQNNSAIGYAWDFGDGTTSTQQQPIHSFDSIGVYHVRLNLTSACGQNTYSDSIQIQGNLHFNNYNSINVPSVACPNEQVTFNLNNGLNPYQQIWYFGNGDSSLTANPTYAYTKVGTYQVKCKVTNGCGNDTILAGVITIGKTGWNNTPINSSLSKTALCPGDATQYQVQNSATKYLWNFGDGNTSSMANGQYIYTATGTYTVSLTLTNYCGVDTTVTYPTIVNVSNGIDPTVSHDGNGNNNWGVLQDSACVGDSILVYAFQGAHYSYDFGDGTISNKTYPYTIPNFATVDMIKHAYSSPGTYKIKITYYNNCNNFANDSLNVVVGLNKNVVGGIQQTCGQGCSYQACSAVPFIATGGNTFNWHFGDGDSLITSQPAIFHTYGKGGVFHYKLKVTNACGNSAIYSDSVQILGIALKVNTQNVTCHGGNDGAYKVLVSNGTPPYSYSINNNAYQSVDSAFGLAVSNYTVTVKDANGCSSSTAIAITEPPVMVITPIINDASCKSSNGSISLNVTGNNPDYSYYWSNKKSTATLSALGAGVYEVTVTDAKGCTGTTSAVLDNSSAPTVNITSIVNPACFNSPNCIATAIAAPSGGTGAYTYSWSSGSTKAQGSGLCVGLNYVTVTDHSGCIAVAPVDIVAPAPINISSIQTDVSCAGSATGQIQLNVSGGTSPYVYSWSNAKTGATVSQLVAGNYSVTVSDANSCSSTQAFTILDGVKPNYVPICMVTVDSLSLHNHIIWQKPVTSAIDSFIIYREITTNVYMQVGAVAYTSPSDFADTDEKRYYPNTGNPNQGTYRYKLQVRDTCGNYSALSPYHNTVYISQSNGTFTWNQYEIEGQPTPIPGLNSYDLYRDDNNSGFRILNSVAGSQTLLNDPNYIAFPNARWRVQTNWNLTCAPAVAKIDAAKTSGASLSNIRNNDVFTGIASIANQPALVVYPNPATDIINVEFSNATSDYKIELVNLLGEHIWTKSCQGSKTIIGISNLSNGYYFLRMLDAKGNAIGFQKIIVTR